MLSTLALFATVLSAQEYRGRIQGTVTDAAGGVVPGANVTLTNVNTNVSRSAETNSTGHYLLDLVEPGSYMLAIETPGFARFRAENIVLRQRADVTVDAALELSAVVEEVTVSAQVAQVEFNTSKFETTIDNQIAAAVPQFFRNPFFLSKIDPSVRQSETRLESMPYHSTGTGTQSVGASRGMDLQVDGAPVSLGTWTGYVPSPDMVQEVNIQVNTVDAEFGQSTGSAISLTLKSGTNEYHGLGFYQGVYPWANAILNRVSRTENVQRNHMYGGTLGGPILRDKLFNFVSYEGWQLTDPQTLTGQLPTDLERRGDFSASLNTSGALRRIYDPWSTQTSADGKTVTRTPFPNNTIPAATISSVANAYSAVLPAANQPGVGNYHARNYVVPIRLFTPYKNFSNRTDYVINDKLRYAGRVSLFRTPITVDNPTGSDLAWSSDRFSNRHATQISNDLTWMASPATVVNGSFIYYGWVDESAPKTSFDGYDSLWPNSDWYKPIWEGGLFVEGSPGMQITHGDGGAIMQSYSPGIGTNGPYWIKHPWQDTADIKVAHQRGEHYMKAGFETRGASVWQVNQIRWPYFSFNAQATAATYVNPDTRVSGDGYASFLLGAPNGGQMPVRVKTTLSYRTFSLYFNDDWKITRRLTLNLGLRYEYEQPFREDENRGARGPDLTVPIPQLQGANAPQMPAQVQQFYGGPWIFNGAYRWTEDDHRGQWNADSGVFSPRLGLAFRVNDTTAVRVGWGRYITPWISSTNITQGNSYGFDLDTTVPSPVLGVPQMNLDNPFPSSYPLQPVRGKSLGVNTGLGDNLAWFNDDRERQRTDRFNISVQRQLPFGIVADVTYFLNFSNVVATRNINQVDPRIAYENKSATNVSVANPFYNLLPENEFPGPLRNQRTVNLTALAVPYPQYGSLTATDFENNGANRYHQFSVKIQKSYDRGLSLQGGYSYNRERSLEYYDDIAQYLQQRTWQDGSSYRHRITLAGTWELPLGRGRAFLNALPRGLDAILGGWNVSPILTWRSGNFVRFGGLVETGVDPHVANPGPDGWFNPAAFARLPAFTPRSNPWQYSGINGPGYLSFDTSLVKAFKITERFSAELRLDTFNTPNSMTWNDPTTNVTSTFFGKSSDQFRANGVGVGRQTQFGLRVKF